MTKVVFVGEEPSKLNVDPNIPFVGARCFKTLVSWIKELQPDYYVCLNCSKLEDIDKLLKLYCKGEFSVIALGNKASKTISKYGIEHHKMPHPSGKNFKLNNKQYVALELYHAHSYLLGLKEEYK
jgi:hypothetical protein